MLYLRIQHSSFVCCPSNFHSRPYDHVPPEWLKSCGSLSFAHMPQVFGVIRPLKTRTLYLYGTFHRGKDGLKTIFTIMSNNYRISNKTRPWLCTASWQSGLSTNLCMWLPIGAVQDSRSDHLAKSIYILCAESSTILRLDCACVVFLLIPLDPTVLVRSSFAIILPPLYLRNNPLVSFSKFPEISPLCLCHGFV